MEFKPLNLAQLYQGADAAVAQAMQTNLLVLQTSRMKQEFDEEDALRTLARSSTTTSEDGTTSFDLKSFTKAAYGVNPMKAMAFEKSARDAETAGLQREKLAGEVEEQRRKGAKDRLELMGNASTAPYLEYKKLVDGGVADAEARERVQPLYIKGIQNLVSSGLFTKEQLAKFDLRPQFDPAIAKAGMDQVMGAKESLDAYFRERGFQEPKSDLGRLEADFKSGKLSKANFDAKIEKELGADWQYDPDRSILVNKRTADTKPVTAGGQPLPPKSGDVEGLRKEFNNREEVKNYNAAVPVWRSIANAPDTGAGDLDLIYGAGKILDPGSVVREGEMALTIKTGSPLQRILGTTQFSLEQGGRLTADTRKKLVEAMHGRITELHNAATDARKPFEAQARRQNIPLEETLTLPDLPQVGKGKGGKGTSGALQAPAAGTVQDGYKFKGGDPSKPESWEKVD